MHKARLRGFVAVSRMFPPSLALSELLDLAGAVVSSSVHAWALTRRHVPCVRAGQILRPERPGSTLTGSNGIDRTLLLTVALAQEDAVLRQSVFDDARSRPHAAQIPLSQLIHRYPQLLGDPLQFELHRPDVPFPRPGTAPPALPALKVQPFNVPFRPCFVTRHESMVAKTSAGWNLFYLSYG